MKLGIWLLSNWRPEKWAYGRDGAQGQEGHGVWVTDKIVKPGPEGLLNPRVNLAEGTKEVGQ
jgi:hypothetical protein